LAFGEGQVRAQGGVGCHRSTPLFVCCAFFTHVSIFLVLVRGAVGLVACARAHISYIRLRLLSCLLARAKTVGGGIGGVRRRGERGGIDGVVGEEEAGFDFDFEGTPAKGGGGIKIRKAAGDNSGGPPRYRRKRRAQRLSRHSTVLHLRRGIPRVVCPPHEVSTGLQLFSVRVCACLLASDLLRQIRSSSVSLCLSLSLSRVL
ncbi:unnamed protein product, partial [Scytosiphon promiscuus]